MPRRVRSSSRVRSKSCGRRCGTIFVNFIRMLTLVALERYNYNTPYRSSQSPFPYAELPYTA